MFLTQQKQAGRLLYAGMVPSKIPCQLPPPEMPQVLPRLLSFLNITFPGPPPLWLLAVLLLSQELACLGTGEKKNPSQILQGPERRVRSIPEWEVLTLSPSSLKHCSSRLGLA